ncbi:MAG: hypothetical protein ACR2PK_03735 [Acidimicrobiales bacterium]
MSQHANSAETAVATPTQLRTGLDIELSGDEPVRWSDEWTFGGWVVAFARLGPGAATSLDQSRGPVYLKVIVGELANIALNPCPPRGEVRSTLSDATEVVAGLDGAIFAVFIQTDDVPPQLKSMDQLGFAGRYAELLQWQSFYDLFGGYEYFKDIDAHMVPGFHLLDSEGTEIAYVHFWTMGKGGDASTHNHSREPSDTKPAFVEVHWVLNNGTGEGGMYMCDSQDGPRTPMVMQRGEEHGPFWAADANGGPRDLPNGAVEYPWHGWEAGPDDGTGQSFDLVAAFEINPKYAPSVTA